MLSIKAQWRCNFGIACPAIIQDFKTGEVPGSFVPECKITDIS